MMSDDPVLYIPDSFTKVSWWKAAEKRWSLPSGVSRDAYYTLSEYNPQVFIRSNFDRVDTTWVAYKSEMAYLNLNYSIVKRIPYSTTAGVSYPRNEIVVYERATELQVR